MKIEGTYTLHAPPDQVWYSMQNPHILRQIVPGLKNIEALDEQTFILSLAMNQAPFVGTYEGRITITERQYPYHFCVALQNKNDQGSLQGEIHIHLQRRAESTIIAYTGAIHLDFYGQKSSTTLARGAAKLLVQQFFTALNDQLNAQETTNANLAAVIEHSPAFNPTGNVSVKNKNGIASLKKTSENMRLIPDPLWTEKRDEQQGIFYKMARILKLGDGNPEQERLWTYRLRTASTIAGLLFLIWVGMHIPRQQKRK
jgi:carbon monoxide dehydrogenase subunit G